MSCEELTLLTQDLEIEHKTSKILNTISISRSTFYYKQKRDDEKVYKNQESILLPLIQEVHEECDRTYGIVRITQEIKKKNLSFKIGPNRVRRIMRKNSLYCETIRKFRPHNRSKVYELGENLLNQNFEVSELNKVWVTDITYIYIPGAGFTYLATVIDLATRKPVGWHYSKHMKTSTAKKAVENALFNQNFPQGVIVHSDRGSQYTSKKFRNFLKLHKLVQSLSAKGCPYDNAVIESFHASIKKELIYRRYFVNFETAKLAIFKYIEHFYIRKRMHSYLNYLTPQQMEDKLKSKNLKNSQATA